MKVYSAKLDTIIEGRPTAAGALIRGLSEDKAAPYVGAGLIEEVKAEDEEKAKSKDQKAAGAAFKEAAKKIDTTADNRTEK